MSLIEADLDRRKGNSFYGIKYKQKEIVPRQKENKIVQQLLNNEIKLERVNK